MDINGWNLDKEYFGFGSYPRLQRSNVDFLNFNVEDTDAYKTLTAQYNSDIDKLRTDAFAKADALGYGEADSAKRKDILDTLEKDLSRRKKIYDAQVALIKVQQGASAAQQTIGKNQGLLDLFGIRTQPSAPAQVQVNQRQGNEPQPTNYTPLYVILGIAAVGGLGFLAYKMAK